MTVKPRYKQIQEHLLDQASKGIIPTAREVATQFEVSRPYVHMLRSELIRDGRLPVSPRGRGGAPNEERLERDRQRRIALATIRTEKAARAAMKKVAKPLLANFKHTDLFDAIVSGKGTAMTLDQRRAFLSELALRTHREEIKVQSISALNRLEASLHRPDSVGPGPPKTRDEADERLAALTAAHRELFPHE